MLVNTYAAALQSIYSQLVTIEVSCSPGINFQLVGLPDTAIKESQDRILTAIKESGYKWPGKYIVINLSPAGLRKEGAAYDLPIALGILASDGQIQKDRIDDYLIMGELSLNGSIKPIKGALPITIMAKEKGFKGVILPQDNVHEASVVSGIDVLGADSLLDVIDFFMDKKELKKYNVDINGYFKNIDNFCNFDFEDVKGQENVKRAMEIAAAGGHNILMIGAPGSGKSMIAKRLPGILPPFTMSEALETTTIYSVAGKMNNKSTLLTQRPFRAPHHSISSTALVGGGSNPQPGEISLAHNGILFLDELPEFKRSVLEVMRQPMEDRIVTIARAKFSVDYPAGFMLVAAMNPCPCGYYTHPTRQCECSPNQVQNYLNKISGPLLDRIDIQVQIAPVSFEELSMRKKGESSRYIRERVVKARNIQNIRFANSPDVHCNAQMTPRMMSEFVNVDDEGMKRLKTAMEKFSLSARAYDRILKVARTIADLDGKDKITGSHIAEAISYRSLDRANWGRKT